MEKDIKILEHLVDCLKNPKPFRYTNEQKAIAIENLIKEYKELKQLEDVTYKTLKDTNFIHKNYIPKSLAREKIEEINLKIEEVDDNIDNSAGEESKYWKKEKHDLIMQRYILQELLQEGDK